MDSGKIKMRLFFIFLIILLMLGMYLFIPEFSVIQQRISEEEIQPDFEVDQILMKVLIKSNESMSRNLRIMNTDRTTLDFTVNPSSSLDYIVGVSEVYFTLTPGQTKILQVDFKSAMGTIEFSPGVYVGKLIIKSVPAGSETEAEAVSKSIPMVVEVESKAVLFDTNLNVQPQYRRVLQGNDIIVNIKLFNLLGIEPTSVLMDYSIKDLNGNTIIIESETVVVATQASFTKVMQIPINLKPGAYVFSVKSEYGTSVGTSSYLFEITEYEMEWEIPPVLKACVRNVTCVVGLSVLVIVVLMIIFSLVYFRVSRRGRPRPKPKPVRAVKEFVPPTPPKPSKPKIPLSERLRTKIEKWKIRRAKKKQEEKWEKESKKVEKEMLKELKRKEKKRRKKEKELRKERERHEAKRRGQAERERKERHKELKRQEKERRKREKELRKKREKHEAKRRAQAEKERKERERLEKIRKKEKKKREKELRKKRKKFGGIGKEKELMEKKELKKKRKKFGGIGKEKELMEKKELLKRLEKEKKKLDELGL